MKGDFPMDNEKINALIVDDDKTLCKMLEDMLSKEEYLNVTSTHDGLDATQKIKENKFDLILTDLMMPGADGIEVLRVAKEIDENVHVILVTGYASLETAMEAIKKGAYDYITKPFKLEEIKVAVQNVCEKIQLVRKNQELLASLTRAYDDIEELKESRDELNVKVDTINEKMEERQVQLAENIVSLQTLPNGLPPSYYLRRRRSDKGYVLVELEKLGKLRNEGIITEEEFQSCKRKFLRGI
jgi:DNA-binding NtrC family response regulator